MGKCRYDISKDCDNRDCLKCMLDKIRADIAELWKNEPCPIEYGCLNEILQIIDKYKEGI